MHVKCSYCDFTLRTVISVVIWLDVIVSGCILSVQIADTNDPSCLERKCSFLHRIAGCLLVNITVALLAIYAVRQRKPMLMFPYMVCKILLVVVIILLLIFWKPLIQESSSDDEFYPRINIHSGIALFIVFTFQLYAIFMTIWSYKKTSETLASFRHQKSFKSVISIWIGDASKANCSDSTCIIETERPNV